MHVNPLFPSRRVRRVPSCSTRTTAAPFATASGAADKACVVYSASDTCWCSALAGAQIANSDTVAATPVFNALMYSSSELRENQRATSISATDWHANQDGT